MNKLAVLSCTLLLFAGPAAHAGPGRDPEAVAQAVLETVPGPAAEDFLVNDDTAGGCKQGSPAAASDSAGNAVIAWADQRNGYAGYWDGMYYFSGWDIYFRRFDGAGNPAGPDQRVNDPGKPAAHSNPEHSVAMSPGGRFVIVWQEMTAYPHSVISTCFQVFDASGNRIGPNRQVPHCAADHMPVSSSAAMDGNGGFVIAWTDRSEDYMTHELHFLRYDPDGNPMVTGTESGLATVTHFAQDPCIGMAPDGRFAIAWTGSFPESWNNDLCVKCFDANGDSVGLTQKVSDDTIHVGQESPSIAMDNRGAFVIAWEDCRNHLYEDVDIFDVYFQQFDSSGQMIGSNRMANDDGGRGGKNRPAVTLDSDGRFAIAWDDKRLSDHPRIFYQIYGPDGATQGNNQRAGVDEGTGSQFAPCAALTPPGGLFLAWEDTRNGAVDQDVNFQHIDISGGSEGSPQRVIDDTGSCEQTAPSIAMAGNGAFIAAWTDDRDGTDLLYPTYDVYMQCYDAQAGPVGRNGKVNDGYRRNQDPPFPVVAADSSGRFAVAWRDERNIKWDIYCQFYDAAGQPSGSNQKVNDDAGESLQSSPSIAMNACGDCVIAWSDTRGGSFNECVYFQRFNRDGDPVGRNQKVEYASPGSLPAVAMDDAGSFVIAWWIDMFISIGGNSQSISDICFQRFDRRGDPLGKRRKANDAGEGGRHGPSIAMKPDGGFVIAWQDRRSGDLDVYFQSFDAAGIAEGPNRRANDDSGTAAQYAPTVAMDRTGRFAILWSDVRFEAGPSLVGQRFNAQGTPADGNFRITSEGSHYYPAASADEENIVMAWQDNRRSKGFDIFGKRISWDWEGMSDVALEPERPLDFGLLPNVPNPFNPETRIPFLLPSAGRVRLSLFNSAGRWVRDLVHGEQDAGLHQVLWDGTDHTGLRVNSGIYICRISTESGGNRLQSTRKICLVR